MANNLNPDIFLSYSWKNNNVADEIDNTFKSVGIQFRRDVRDAPYLTNIKEYMHQAGKTNFVLMIISDEYLKSENCMYEVTVLLNTNDFEKRVLPVVIDNATAIFRVPNQEVYYEHWKKRAKEADILKKRHANAATFEYAEKCQDINKHLPNFFQKITQLNVSTYEALKKNNYRDLLNIVGFHDKKVLEEVIEIAKNEKLKPQKAALQNKHLDNKYALFNKALSASGQHLYLEAKKNYEAAIKIDPTFAFAHYNLGLLLNDHFSNYEGAKRHYETAIKIDPNFASAHNNLGLLIKDHFSDYEGAKKHYEAAIKIDPNYANAHNNLANLLSANCSDHNGAKKHYEEVIKTYPNNVLAHFGLAYLLENNFSDYDGARKHYETVIKIDPNYSEGYNNLGLLLQKHFSDYDGARKYYELGIKVDPKNAFLYYNLAILLEGRFSDYKGAKKHYEIAIKANPKYALACILLGVLLEHRFLDYEGAKFNYKRALEIDSEFDLAKTLLNGIIEKHFQS